MIFDELRDWQHAVTDESKGYNNVEIVPIMFENAETAFGEDQVEENMRRSMRQRDMPARLQDF